MIMMMMTMMLTSTKTPDKYYETDAALLKGNISANLSLI